MTGHIVSARKYRPDTFESVVGQSHITDTLRNAIKQDHLAHSFLFTGPRGVGKTTCARILAKTINCQHVTEDGEACNNCDSCRVFNENKSLNIYELDAASNNSVEDIRSLVEQVRFGPQGGRYKVYIIDEVHMLSQSAFNAFLKTLEEPPSYAVFILATTEKHKIIPTILSRCQIFDFNRIQVADIRESLATIAKREGIDAEPEALHMIAQKADGALRDALSLYDRVVSFSGSELTYQVVIDNLNILDYEYFFKATEQLIQKDLPNTLLTFNEVLQQGFDGHNYLSGLSEHMRNLLVSKDPQTIPLLELTEQLRERYQNQANQVSSAFLLSSLNILNYYDLNYKASKNQRLHTEIALMKLAHLNDAISLAESQAESVLETRQSSEHTSKKKVTTESSTGIDTSAKPEANKVNSQQANDPDNEDHYSGGSLKNKATEKANGANASDTKTEVSPKISGLDSIKTQIKNHNSNIEKTESPSEIGSTQASGEVIVTQEIVEGLWQQFLHEALKDQQFLYNNLVGKAIKLNNDYTVTFKVESKAVKDKFEEQKTRLVDYMQTYFGGTPVAFQAIVEPPTQEQKRSYLVNVKDKYDAMVEKNPKLKVLQERLGLHIDQ